MLETILDIFKHSLMITAFVLIIMLIIEYVNVSSRGAFNNALKKRGWMQIFVATILGLVPGCVGTFTVVSLYSHNILSLGALVAALISASGDEAFFMFSMIPETAIKLNIILFIMAIVFGFVVDYVIRKKPNLKRYESHLQIHDHETERVHLSISSIKEHFKSISFPRALLLLGIFLFVMGLVTGTLDDVHLHAKAQSIVQEDLHNVHHGFFGFEPSGVNIIFLIVSVLALILIVIVPDHFLEHHLWDHIIKKHFLKVLLWTAGALALTAVILNFIDVSAWIHNNLWVILIVAVLIGIIPESGPHMIFISLFMSGTIPFSILLANTIVQDGHGALPLLAESKRSFFLVKTINTVIAFSAGALGLLIGF
jgi:hypothetical protein